MAAQKKKRRKLSKTLFKWPLWPDLQPIIAPLHHYSVNLFPISRFLFSGFFELRHKNTSAKSFSLQIDKIEKFSH